MTNESESKPLEELQLWLELLQTASANGQSAAAAVSAKVGFAPRVETVSRCLRLLDEMWFAASRTANGESEKAADEETPHADWNPEESGDFLFNALATPDKRSKRLGRFMIGERLGQGGHGFVFRAHDPVLNRDVALKIPRPDSLASPELRRRFVDEAQVLARLQHANLVSVLEAGTVGPVCYLVTPYCPGPSLSEWIKRQEKPIAIELAARLVRDLATTVDYVHSRGILHRDIKPSNVLLDPLESPSARDAGQFGFTPKLTDFGLAKLTENSVEHTATGAMLGTPAYMAPEQAEGRLADVGVATDVYALGATLYELLTGRPPFRGNSEFQTLRLVSDGCLLQPRRLRANTPPDLDAICLKCLELKPSCRYHSARDLADDLQRFLENRPVTARPIGCLSRLGRHARRRPAVWGLAATLLLSLIMGTGIASWNAYRLQLQSDATTNAFGVAFQRWHEMYLMARRGVPTTAGILPLDDKKRSEIAAQFNSFLGCYADEVPIRYDVVYGYMCLAMLHRENGEEEQFRKYAAKAVTAGERLIREADQFQMSRQHLATTSYDLATLDLYCGNKSQALEGYQRARHYANQLLKSGDAIYEKDVHATLAKSHFGIAQLLKSSNRLTTLPEYESACREFRALARQWPNDQAFRQLLASASIAMGKCLLHLDRTEDAFVAIDEARRLCEDSKPANDFDWCTTRRNYAQACLQLARDYCRLDPVRAQQWYERAIESREQCAAKEPDDVAHRRWLARAHSQLASYFRRNGRRDESLAAYLDALDYWQPLLKEDLINENDRRRAEACQRHVVKLQSRSTR
jgi:tetratricopeptide (TPR) repeat protein/tRNA A-37 threonylcarbamoyl transferase component Bud32